MLLQAGGADTFACTGDGAVAFFASADGGAGGVVFVCFIEPDAAAGTELAPAPELAADSAFFGRLFTFGAFAT
jgi:hypothetical protein